MLRQKKNARIHWDEERKPTQLEQKIQLEEINQNVLAKKEDKYWQGPNNVDKTAYCKKRKEISICKWGKMCEEIWATGCEGSKIIIIIWERRDHSRRAEWINNKKKESSNYSKKAIRRKYTPIHSEQHSKNKNWKTPGHGDIRRFWF